MRLVLAGVLAAALALPAAAQEIVSEYTDLDSTKHCSAFAAPADGDGDWINLVCSGWRGYPVLIYQGDLLNRPGTGDPAIANDTSVHFLNWIDAQKLAVDATIPVHGPLTTIADFRKAVAEKKDRAN